MMNSAIYNDLLLAMTNDMSFGLVEKANSIGYPKGGASTTWGILMQCFESQTNASKSVINMIVNSSRLKKINQDPGFSSLNL